MIAAFVKTGLEKGDGHETASSYAGDFGAVSCHEELSVGAPRTGITWARNLTAASEYWPIPRRGQNSGAGSSAYAQVAMSLLAAEAMLPIS